MCCCRCFSFPSEKARASNSVFGTVLVLIAPLVYSRFHSYVSVDPATAQLEGDGLREDWSYRCQLIPAYLPIVEEHPTWGWRCMGFPVINRMWSIDNAYLFTALTFGMYELALRVALSFWPPIQLAGFSLAFRPTDPRALAAFNIIDIYVVIVVMDCTGSGGGTPSSFMLLIAAWAVALLTSRIPRIEPNDAVLYRPQSKSRSRRIMA